MCEKKEKARCMREIEMKGNGMHRGHQISENMRESEIEQLK